MGSKRVLWVDIAKGVAMLAVVLGHTYHGGMPAHTFVYSFHVPLFFILAGYTFRVKPTSQVIRSSAERLLLPYLVLAIILAIFGVAKGWLNSDTLFQFSAGVLFASGGVDLPMGIFSIGIPWFLMALFVARVLYNVLLGLLQKINAHIILQTLLFAVLAWGANRVAPYIPLPFAFWQSVIAMFFMHLGYAIHELDLAEKAPIPLTLACLAVWVATMIYGAIFSIGNLWFGNSFILGAIMAIAASWCVLQACRFIEKHMRRIGDFLAFIGVNSLLVLELHVVDNQAIAWSSLVIEPLGWFSPVVFGVMHLVFVLGLLALVVLSPLKMGKKSTDG